MDTISPDCTLAFDYEFAQLAALLRLTPMQRVILSRFYQSQITETLKVAADLIAESGYGDD